MTFNSQNKCEKCGKEKTPLFHIETYCPNCESDNKPKKISEQGMTSDEKLEIEIDLDLQELDLTDYFFPTPKKGTGI